MRDQILARELAERGVFFPGHAILAEDGGGASNDNYDASKDVLSAWKRDYRICADANPSLVTPELRMALDAQPGMVTTPNAGIPLLFTSVVDPQVIRTVFQPLNMAEIMGGEVQKGSWIDDAVYFPQIDPTGQVATYNDFSDNGAVDANPNWTPRQPYPYQTWKRWGDKQVARYGAAAINYNSELDLSRVRAFNTFQNKTYAFGVTGLINYGLLNDPGLITAIAPRTKTAGGTSWSVATAKEIYQDVTKLFRQLVTQMGGNVDMNAVMTLALSNTSATYLVENTDFSVQAEQMIRKAFPNMTVKTAPQYTTGSGELMQLILVGYDGAQTAYPAYTEKLRVHRLEVKSSNYAQKFSGGTLGAVVRRPIAVAQMVGI